MAKSWKNLPHWKNWRPREGQFYYYITPSKEINKEMWMGMKVYSYNSDHYKAGNIYESEEQAKRALVKEQKSSK